jgi:hypothetical protein
MSVTGNFGSFVMIFSSGTSWDSRDSREKIICFCFLLAPIIQSEKEREREDGELAAKA